MSDHIDMSNVFYPYNGYLTMNQRNSLNRHKSGLIWLYGLSGSGKSTIAHKTEFYLHVKGIHSCVLDGDNVRSGLNKDLGLTPVERNENIRRVAEVAKLMVNSGILVIAAFITPYEEGRQKVRQIMKDLPFYEVFVSTPLEVCMERDPKGLYEKAVTGELSEFTGISAPFEIPRFPDYVIDTSKLNAEEATNKLINFLVNKKLILIEHL